VSNLFLDPPKLAPHLAIPNTQNLHLLKNLQICPLLFAQLALEKNLAIIQVFLLKHVCIYLL